MMTKSLDEMTTKEIFDELVARLRCGAEDEAQRFAVAYTRRKDEDELKKSTGDRS